MSSHSSDEKIKRGDLDFLIVLTATSLFYLNRLPLLRADKAVRKRIWRVGFLVCDLYFWKRVLVNLWACFNNQATSYLVVFIWFSWNFPCTNEYIFVFFSLLLFSVQKEEQFWVHLVERELVGLVKGFGIEWSLEIEEILSGVLSVCYVEFMSCFRIL